MIRGRVLLSASLLLAALVGCGTDSPPASSPARATPRPVPVEVVAVAYGPMEDVVYATGTVEALRRSVLSAEVAGTIAAMDVEVGQAVEPPSENAQGTLIAAIKDDTYRIAVERAAALRDMRKASSRQALLNYEREKARTDDKALFEEPLRTARFQRDIAQAQRDLAAAADRDAARELQRHEALTRKGVSSENELDAARVAADSARAKLEAAKSTLEDAAEQVRRQEAVFASALLSREKLDTTAALRDAAKAQLDSAQAELDAAEKDRRDCRIAPPYPAALAEKLVEVGQRVAPGTPVAVVVDTSQVKIRAGLPAHDRVRIALRAPARVQVYAYPGLERAGAVTALAPVADADTGNFVVEITVDNDPKDRPLLPGMTATVELVAGTLERACRLPGAAILGGETTRHVYVVTSGDGADVVRRRALSVIRTVGTSALIGPDSGLREGDRVVLRGQRGLRDGTPVEVTAPNDPEPVPTPATP